MPWDKNGLVIKSHRCVDTINGFEMGIYKVYILYMSQNHCGIELNCVYFRLQMERKSFASQIVSIDGANLLTSLLPSALFYCVLSLVHFNVSYSSNFFLFHSFSKLSSFCPSALFFSILPSIIFFFFSCSLPFHSSACLYVHFFPSCLDVMWCDVLILVFLQRSSHRYTPLITKTCLQWAHNTVSHWRQIEFFYLSSILASSKTKSRVKVNKVSFLLGFLTTRPNYSFSFYNNPVAKSSVDCIHIMHIFDFNGKLWIV